MFLIEVSSSRFELITCLYILLDGGCLLYACLGVCGDEVKHLINKCKAVVA